jgi:precorrin-6B methylase 2
MITSLIEKLFSFIHIILFKIIGQKMQPDLLKNFVDRSFRFFEKIVCRFYFLANFYLNLYQKLIENELKILKINEKDTVLVIGSGSLPATSILVAMKTGASVESIDFDKRAVIESKRYIDFFNLKNKLNIVHADGTTYPVKKFDVIIIVYGIRNEKEVLRHIARNMSNTTRVVFRTTVNAYLSKKNYKFDIANLFEIKKYIRTNSLGQVDSILLYRKTSKNESVAR